VAAPGRDSVDARCETGRTGTFPLHVDLFTVVASSRPVKPLSPHTYLNGSSVAAAVPSKPFVEDGNGSGAVPTVPCYSLILIHLIDNKGSKLITKVLSTSCRQIF
jgi:hypothetical protein